MGFWSAVGNMAQNAMQKTREANEEADVLADDYRGEDDDFLKRKLQSGRVAERLAATRVLKERGYGS